MAAFAPNSTLRAAVTPAHRGRGAAKPPLAYPTQPCTPRHVAMSWARRLKRVFGIDIQHCAGCGGTLQIIARIEDPEVIAKILSHRVERTAPPPHPPPLPLAARAPPRQAALF
jgi:pyruvate/2-oxoglutarate dehydrogenase complex dihydrolipoamide acyltransferase (E2) component